MAWSKIVDVRRSRIIEGDHCFPGTDAWITFRCMLVSIWFVTVVVKAFSTMWYNLDVTFLLWAVSKLVILSVHRRSYSITSVTLIYFTTFTTKWQTGSDIPGGEGNALLPCRKGSLCFVHLLPLLSDLGCIWHTYRLSRYLTNLTSFLKMFSNRVFWL